MYEVSFQQKVFVFDKSMLTKNSAIGFPINNISLSDDVIQNHFNSHSLIIQTENLLFYIDMINMNSIEDQFLFIDDDFEEPNADDILKMNQYAIEIRRIIESHNAKWILYQSTKSQSSKSFDIDDHTISSIERI